jgi:hypothetical protein
MEACGDRRVGHADPSRDVDAVELATDHESPVA